MSDAAKARIVRDGEGHVRAAGLAGANALWYKENL